MEFEIDSWWDDSVSDIDLSDTGTTDTGTDGLFDGVWDWAKSESGTSTATGMLKTGLSMWSEEMESDDREEDSIRDNAYATAKTERINKHNKSINTPLKMDLRKFKK